MLRLLAFLAVLGLAAYGLDWLARHPGAVTLNWLGETREITVMQALGYAAAALAALLLALILLGFVARAPGRIGLGLRARRREKGMLALSRGLVAVGAGDAGEALRQSREADKHAPDEPLTLLLRAQAAQAAGERAAAIAAFNEMLRNPNTHVLGLRGLHVEARRAKEPGVALDYARRAYARARAPWAAQALREDYAARGDWAQALATVETDARAGLIAREVANRWRAVLKTALAQERADRDPRSALALAREALELAPTFPPSAVVAARLTAAAGDLRRAAKILETAWREASHPDLADAYVHLRPGDAAGDRLSRARTLARIAPHDPESVVMLARAEAEAQDLSAARVALASLIGEGRRPTQRVCLLMAEIEQAANDDGAVREWLARAARAPRDRAWVAGEIIADRWAPAAPDGTLDAFQWRTPDERMAAPAPPLILQAAPPPPAPAAMSEPAPVAPRPARRFAAPSATLIANAPDDPGPQTPAALRGFVTE